MEYWIPEETRLLALVVLCAMLWSLESLIPIYPRRSGRLWQAAPNVALALLLILTNLSLSFSSALIASYAVKSKTGLLFLLDLPHWAIPALSITGLDLFAYVAHVLLHKSRLGWRFHRVHHSENEVDVTTAFRQHPGETVWRILWQLAAIAVFGIPLWMVVIYLTVSGLSAQFEHANIRMNRRLDRLLRLVVVTPDMHKAHHSRKQSETDSNYSNIFSFWDRLFGTHTPEINFHELRYGLEGFDDDDRQSLAGLLMTPFLRHEK